MADAKHTPRWLAADEIARAEALLIDPDGEDCERFASWYGSALLHAAKVAPDLLFALRRCIQRLERPNLSPGTDVVLETARAAIAKASPSTPEEKGEA